MKRVLLLNSAYEPLRFIEQQAAIRLVLRGVAQVEANWNDEWKSERFSIKLPATLKLQRYVSIRFNNTRFNRNVMFNRDDYECQYCGSFLTRITGTVDHVVPKFYGGKTTYKNCVSSCKSCNRRKANRTPEEAKMVLRKPVTLPTNIHFLHLDGKTHWHESWSTWFGTSR